MYFNRFQRWLISCLTIVSGPLWAATSDWNCVQNPDNQQWTCDATRSVPSKTKEQSVEPATLPKRATQTAAPVLAKPAVTEPTVKQESAVSHPDSTVSSGTDGTGVDPSNKTTEVIPPNKVEEPLPHQSTTPSPVTSERPVSPSSPPAVLSSPHEQTVHVEKSDHRPDAHKPMTSHSSSGWHCVAGEASASGKGWNCSRGARADSGASSHREGSGSFQQDASDTITQEDEARFQGIMSLLPRNPWENVCAYAVTGIRTPLPVMPEFTLTSKDREARLASPIDVHSDYFEMLDSEVANFSGGAELVKADQRLWGDFLTRNLLTHTVNVHGSVYYQEKGLALSSDTGFLDTDTNRGVFRNTQFIFPQIPARGTSRMTYMDGRSTSRYENFTYTACPPGDQSWTLHASHVKVNRDSGVGSAQNAFLEFKGVPILYTPYMSFPTDDRRTSGLLSPSFALTKVGGFDFSIPYYFNLAPNYDYTARPRYLTNRGFLLRNEFRYLTDMTKGRLVGDIMPYDEKTGTMRGQVGFLNDTRFSEHLTSHIDGNYVSDATYLNDLGSPLNLVDRRNIRSIGYLNYVESHYNVRAQMDYFQTIDPTIVKNNEQPYFHRPHVVFNYFNEIADTGIKWETQAQFDSFDTSAHEKTTGQRLKFRPRLSYPFLTSAGFITPSFTVLHNEYWLDNPEYWTASQQASWALAGGYDKKTKTSESLTVPIFSLDTGAFFDRDFQWGESPMLQTLEPRLFYVYIPKVNQDSIPVFDSSAYDFTYYQLFRENRFTGSDRVGDTNELTAALTTRLVAPSTGQEWLRASVGNILYFQDREVTLGGPPADTLSEGYSNLVGDVFAGITSDWSVRTGGQWNPQRSQVDRGIIALQYNNKKNEILNIAYRYRRNQYTLDCVKGDPNNGCLDLTDVSFRLPIIEGWHAIGRWQYSLQDQVTLESFFGVERETCCWRFTLLGRHYINNLQADGNNQANNGVFLQLELKGLTRIGDQVDMFLQRSISGYRFKENL